MDDEIELNNKPQKEFKYCIITALFDIQRFKYESNPNALKTIDDYYKCFKISLKLNCPMIIYTEEKTKQFIIDNRPKEYDTKIIIQKLDEIPYYKYREKMLEIINNEQYKTKIKNPNRIECNLPEYCIIQYSKFEWLKNSIEINPFNSNIFFWMDAGCSRFFLNVNILNKYPGPETSKLFKQITSTSSDNGFFIIQGRESIGQLFKYYDENDVSELKWDSINLLIGTMFGGTKTRIIKIADFIKDIFEKDMLDLNCVNNEQIALAILYRRKPNLFNVFESKNQKIHLPLFKLMSN